MIETYLQILTKHNLKITKLRLLLVREK